jgi:nucleoside phosphorylase
MTRLSVAATQADTAIAIELSEGLEAHGYRVERNLIYNDPQHLSSPRSSERNILGSSGIVLVWGSNTKQDTWVMQKLLFAQQIRRPIFPVLLDTTPLPDILTHTPSATWQGGEIETMATLLTLPNFPIAQNTDPFERLCEQAAQERIHQRKEAIELAAIMLKQNKHREGVQAVLKYLAQHDLMMSVRNLAKEVLRTDAATIMANSQQHREGLIVLSDEPLTETETSITLEIMSEAEKWRGKTVREEREGTITLNPQSNLLYALSPNSEMEQASPQAIEGTLWDFYLVHIPFTLHKAPGNNYYREVTFFVELDKPEETAFDLFPTDITMQINNTTLYSVSSDMKIEKLEDISKQVERVIHFNTLYPLITSFGEGEQKFYWRYEGSTDRKEVPPGTKHALIVLRVPHGTQVVDGSIRYTVVVAKHLRGLWSNKDSAVSPYPVRWTLGKVVPPFFPRHVQSEDAKRSMHIRKHARVDVCILCALAEEAEGLKAAFKEELGVTFQREYHDRLKREYDFTTIPTVEGEELGILVTWLPNVGVLETSLQLQPFIEEFQPRFAAMTGICAGDREKVKPGDIIVAERAFLYDAGKFVRNEEGQQKLLHDTRTWSPPIEVIHFARGFQHWKQVVAAESRLPTLHQQRDWLLYTLLELHISQHKEAPKIEDITPQDLEINAPQWRTIVEVLQRGPDAYLTFDRKLTDYTRVADLRYGKEVFPYKDPLQPKVFIAPIASGNAVRSDRPFAMIKEPVRGTIAVDMEGAAFYRTMAGFPGIHSLFVKSVVDYADEDKDDLYHRYASKISARYMLAFIREYVTTRRLPIQ